MARPVTMTPAEKAELQRIRQRQWRKDNPEKVRQQSIARNARKMANKKSIPMPPDDSVVVLDEDRLFYLVKHRIEKRSVLAKKLGVTKRQLFNLLEKYGGGIKC